MGVGTAICKLRSGEVIYHRYSYPVVGPATGFRGMVGADVSYSAITPYSSWEGAIAAIQSEKLVLENWGSIRADVVPSQIKSVLPVLRELLIKRRTSKGIFTALDEHYGVKESTLRKYFDESKDDCDWSVGMGPYNGYTRKGLIKKYNGKSYIRRYSDKASIRGTGLIGNNGVLSRFARRTGIISKSVI